MWSLEKDQEGAVNEGSYHLTVGEHLVGRKECSIKIDGDQSVSRKHARINVLKEGPEKFQVFLKDVSKYGCFINDVKCQSFEAVELKHNDKITFGSQNSSYRLKYESLLVFASCLNQSNKRHMKAQLSKLGGAVVNEWKKGCSHLIMEALSFTVKVIYALVTCIPIVKPSFFDDLVMAVDTKNELPLAKNYMPPIKEELIDPKTVSFHPNEARRSVFLGKLFLFSDQKQVKCVNEMK
ncbi:nibrin-like [Xenia sp. Carnegie-2017]|uniref:nibrin-like n=1 Tax=Xenia sp. Carnegie-2017 TaxID=2897299 RepID=UPI001F036D45|nr:nibrin-like [Xenia sp. Carnegie-2017]